MAVTTEKVEVGLRARAAGAQESHLYPPPPSLNPFISNCDIKHEITRIDLKSSAQ